MSVVFINYEEDNPYSKFNRCVNRSESKEKGISKSCCGGSKEIYSYRCIKRSIFPLQESICENCEIFQEKV